MDQQPNSVKSPKFSNSLNFNRLHNFEPQLLLTKHSPQHQNHNYNITQQYNSRIPMDQQPNSVDIPNFSYSLISTGYIIASHNYRLLNI